MAEPEITEFQPDFVIAWLDVNMGQQGTNQPSKQVLAENANLNPAAQANDPFDHIDQLILRDYIGPSNEPVTKLIHKVLQMFTDQQQCIDFIKETGKKVFLITSGSLGAPVVRELYRQLTDCIYVFCGDRNAHQWTDEYSQHLVVYDDELGVFARVLSDIGIYYLQKHYEESCDAVDAIRYLRWARQFFYRARRMDGIPREDYIEMVNDAIQQREASLENLIVFDDDTMDFIPQQPMD